LGSRPRNNKPRPIEQLQPSVITSWARDLEKTIILDTIQQASSEEYGPKAALVIVPKAYLGWHRQLRQGGTTSSGTVSPPRGKAWVDCSIPHLEAHHRLRSTQEVVTKLDEMYFEEEPKSICFFGEILEQLKEFHVEWVRAGGGGDE